MRPVMVIFLAAVSILAYLPALRNGFVNWDDYEYVVSNPAIREAQAGKIASLFKGGDVRYFAPMVYLSFAADFFFFRHNPVGYHLSNVLFHTLNSILTYFLARFLIGGAAAFIAALFFAIHPLHVESVAWISERKDVLYAFFFLFALLAYAVFLRRRRRNRVFYWIAVVAGISSLLSKPAAAMLPFLVLGIGLRHNRGARICAFREAAPFFLSTAVYFILFPVTDPDVPRTVLGNYRMEPVLYLFVGASNLIFYLIKIILPINLSAWYPLDPSRFSNFSTQVTVIGLLATCSLIAIRFRRTACMGIGSLIYFLCLLPVLQVIPSGTAAAADRFAYLPLFGIALPAACVLLSPSLSLKAVSTLGTGIVIICFSILTWERCRVWETGESLWKSVINRDPQCGKARAYLGSYYLHQGLYQAAIHELRKAIALNPEMVKPYIDLAESQQLSGATSEAIIWLKRAIELFPKEAKAYNNLGMIYGRMGRITDALSLLVNAQKLDPNCAEVYNNLGIVYNLRGETNTAESMFRQALLLDPMLTSACLNLARLLEIQGRLFEANHLKIQAKEIPSSSP